MKLDSRNHADVKAYTLNFLKIMGLHDWSVKINGRLTKTLGRCSYHKKLIELSKTHVDQNQIHEIDDTIRHEIAHAMVGPGFGHGEIWKSAAMKLGAKPRSKNKVTIASDVVVTGYAIMYKKDDGTDEFIQTVTESFYRNKKNKIHRFSLRGRPNSRGKLFFKIIDNINGVAA